MVPMLTAERLRELLYYDPATGIFTWLAPASRQSRIVIGSVAGGEDDQGYIRITIDGKKHRAHRLAWLYMTGEWPSAEIDHQFGAGIDNRWEVIREATRAQNTQNTGKRKDNTTGFKGVSWRARDGKFQARIQVEGKPKSLGYFDTAEQAGAAYAAAAAELHGAFARQP